MGSKDPRIGDVRVVDEKQIIAEEDLVIDAQFLIQEALMERGMTRSELAQQILLCERWQSFFMPWMINCGFLEKTKWSPIQRTDARGRKVIEAPLLHLHRKFRKESINR
jgi:hypothetical protein